MMRLFQMKELGQWFPRKQIEECRMKPTKPRKSCPPPHPGRPIIVGKPHKQKSRVDGAYNAHECVYKCMWILNSVSIGMGSSVYMCISMCVCVCVCMCVSDSSDEDWLQAAALLEATFISVALH